MKKISNVIMCLALSLLAVTAMAKGSNNETNTVRSKNAMTFDNACTLSVSAKALRDVRCRGGDGGAAEAEASGGTSPYTYSWSDGKTTAGASGLSAGSYTVDVTDAVGCTASAGVGITQPAVLRDSAVATRNLLCNGGDHGVAAVVTAGGARPYTYSWSNGETAAADTLLSAGVYSVTVTDSCGAVATAMVTLTQPPPLRISGVVTANVSCFGGNNGAAMALPSGGTPPFRFRWSNGDTLPSAGGLSAGIYIVGVVDTCGAAATASVTITQPAQIMLDATEVSTTSCGSSNGAASVTIVSGGVSPFTYLWSDGETAAATASDLSAGVYTVTVTDNTNCSETAEVAIDNSSGPTATISASTDLSCYGTATGSASVTASGGVSPYTYSWSPAGGTNASAGGLSAGIYNAFVTDNTGCINIATVTITQPPALLVHGDSLTATSGCNGAATVMVRGGVPPYTYLWTTGSQTTDTITGQCEGNYCCVVTDNNGCTETTCVSVEVTTGINTISNTSGINVYPDPNTGQFTIQWSAVNGQSSLVEVYNMLGQRVYETSPPDALVRATSLSPLLEKGEGNLIQINLGSQPNGIYLIRILNENGSLAGEKKIVKI